MANSNRPPLDLNELTDSLRESSGKGINAFFPTPPPPQRDELAPVTAAHSPTQPQIATRAEPEKRKQARDRNVMTSRRHDVNYRAWKEVIEDTESHNSSLRITNEEEYAV